MIALVPEFDDYLRPAEARERFAAVPSGRGGRRGGAKHLWVGYAERVLDEIVRRVAPAAYPLPTEWDGEMVQGDPSPYRDRAAAQTPDDHEVSRPEPA